MIKIVINQKIVNVEKGNTILSAAKKQGISIPTLCYYEGQQHFTSCMICVVKDMKANRLIPACSIRVEDGMIIETDCEEVKKARKTALELLISDHTGDCEGPCQRTCPAHMNIPKMLRDIQANKMQDALFTVREHIALPAILGRICSAPCEKGCRRKQVDFSISICLLKRFVADLNLESAPPYLPNIKPASGKKIAIIGAGPTGLSAAYYLLQQGHACTIFDDHAEPGGMLRYGVSESILPHHVLNSEIEIIRKIGADFKLDTRLGKDVTIKSLMKKFHAIILALGCLDLEIIKNSDIQTSKTSIKINSRTFETSVSGIFSAGCTIHQGKMAVKSAANGRALAFSVNQFLDKKELTGNQLRFNSRIGKLLEIECEEILKNSNGTYALPITEKKEKNNFIKEISSKQAISEAARCLHCECLLPDDCKLRQYADEYQIHPQKYKALERKKIEKIKTHSQIIYEPGKCIKCGLCVRITESYGERLGLTFIGRGFDVRIGVPLNNTLDKGLEKAAAECVEACPTGALVFREDR